MQSTIVAPDDNWDEDTILLSPSDEPDYYVTTITDGDVSPGDPIDVLVGDETVDDEFTGIVMGTTPVDEDRTLVTLSSEVEDAF